MNIGLRRRKVAVLLKKLRGKHVGVFNKTNKKPYTISIRLFMILVAPPRIERGSKV